MNTDELAADHGRELAHCRRLCAHLRHFRANLAPKTTARLQHSEFSDRAASLANYLESALTLVAQGSYPQALALIRAALEHHAMDLLLFLGRRYVQDYKDVDDKTWAEWQRARDQKAEWTLDIVEWRRTQRGVRIVRSGPHLSGGAQGPRALALSRYYFILQDFDPVAGHPKAQKHLDDGAGPRSYHATHAETNRRIYNEMLKWSALKQNLRVNKLYGLRALAHLDVHYTFLSAFVHPTIASFELVYGHNESPRTPPYDHYAAELCVLYVLAIARAELMALERMTKRAPRVGLLEWSTVADDLKLAGIYSAHLWFPPDGRPHTFDRFQDANRRAWRRWGKPGFTVPDPSAIPDRNLRYYHNPLRRLGQMHRSMHEMTTGLVFSSPWERADAQRRF